MTGTTPDEIKKGMEYLSIKDVARKLDAWEDGIPYDCVEDAAADALAYIQQLEADNAQQARCIENMTDKLNALNDELAELQAERDAYRDGLKFELGCYACKNYVDDPDYDSNMCMSCGKNRRNFDWRGVQKEGGM